MDKIPPEVLDCCWQMYQIGQASADHTSKEVFIGVLQSFAKWHVNYLNLQEKSNLE